MPRAAANPWLCTIEDLPRMERRMVAVNERAAASTDHAVHVSVVIPCLDEAENVEECVCLAWDVLDGSGIAGEVIVVDNGSTDGSGELARLAGARVIGEPKRGYGNAYLTGFAAAQGEYIVMADADLTYDLREIPRYISQLEGGADLVMGDRFHRIHAGAMPWLNQHVGNPFLTGLLNRIFGVGVNDANCGMRGLRRSVLPRLDLRADGMEFALEMLIRAAEEKLDIRQIPIELYPRGGKSKLAPWRDGWRSVHIILLHSPRHLFMLPGALMVTLGVAISAVVLTGVSLFGRPWYLHAMIAASLLVIVGVQLVGLGLCGEAYAADFLHKEGTLVERLRRRGFRLKHGLWLGSAFVIGGLALAGVIVGEWVENGFGPLAVERLSITAMTITIVGVQMIFLSLFLSLLELGRCGTSTEITSTTL
jgi:glycosyltransferase involved in cell wall biosynthesis